MSASVDALLGGEDEGEYDLRDEDEDALLEDDDTCEQSRVISSNQDDVLDESADILELNMEETLNDDEEIISEDLNRTSEEDTAQREKFSRERVGFSTTTPDTTSNNQRALQRQQSTPNRGRFNNRRPGRGGLHRGGRGRGVSRGSFQNLSNNNPRGGKVRPEGNKSCFINPHFKGNMQLNVWEKRPLPSNNSPWINNQHNQQPLINNYPPQSIPHQPAMLQQQQHQQQQPLMDFNFQTPQQMQLQQIPPLIPQAQGLNKPPVHQRLGYNNQQLPPTLPFMPPNQMSYEQERQVTIQPLQMQPPGYHGNQGPSQQYMQPPPFNPQPPPPQQHYQNVYPQHGYGAPPPQQSYTAPPPQYNQPPPPVFLPPEQHVIRNNYEPQYHSQNTYQQSPQEMVYGQGGYEHNHHINQQQPQQMPPQNNFNQRQVMAHTNQNRGQTNFVRGNKRFVSHNKRKDWKSEPDNDIKRRTFENKNLHEVQRTFEVKNLHEVQTVDTTTPQIEQVVEEVDEETRKYLKGIAEQKRKRELVMAQKEERRRIEARKKLAEEQFKTLKSPLELAREAKSQPTPVQYINHNLRVVSSGSSVAVTKTVVAESKVEREQLKSFLTNRQILAKDNSLIDTSIVVVNNLAAGTSAAKLKKICETVGDIQNFELSPKERQATIQFKSVASAHTFYKKYQRFMLDLSMIQVSLKPK